MANTVSTKLSDDTLNREIQIESGGNPNAKAATSSAEGLLQFLKGTWLDVVRKHRPDLLEGRGEAEVLALRKDPQTAIELGARFTEDNAAALGNGFTDGDLYLAHFLGVGTARKFLRAAAETPADSLAGAAAVNANRSILAGKTVAQVRAWAQGAMFNRWAKAGKPDWIAKFYHSAPAPTPAPDPDDCVGCKVENADGHIDDPHADRPPAPVPAPEPRDDAPAPTDPKPAPSAPPPKTGITEGAQAAGALSLAGIASELWGHLQTAPEQILTAILTAAQKPPFWVFIGIAGAAYFVWYQRRGQKRAGGA